jgi:ribosome-associated translation inhibitor RaiA
MASQDEFGLIVFEKNLDLKKAIDGTILKKLEKCVGEINTITAICYLLNRFNSNFNVGKSLTQQQSAILAADIVEKYPYETIEDVVLMLKQARQGIIGDGKDYKLDGQNVLTKWFPEYLEKKYTEFERIKKQEMNSNKAEIDNENHPVTIFYAKQKAEKRKGND